MEEIYNVLEHLRYEILKIKEFSKKIYKNLFVVLQKNLVLQKTCIATLIHLDDHTEDEDLYLTN